MAVFKTPVGTQAIIDKCIDAIQNAFQSELWLPEFIQQAQATHTLPAKNVICYWTNIKNQNINWQYVKKFQSNAAYYYEDFTGRMLHIAEDDFGRSKVYHITGFSNEIEEKLNGLDTDELYDNIERFVESRFPDNIDLLIEENIR